MTVTEPHSLADREVWKVRRIVFEYSGGAAQRSWHPKEPEFARFVESISLSMPYLEPYLIAVMRLARPDIDDPVLLREVDLYIGQESAHFRQHQKLNDEIATTAPSARALEARFSADYAEMLATRSRAFGMAYAEGFEALTMAIGQVLVERRTRFFDGASPAVTSMILWHMVEEIEHKTVTFDVFERLDGRYWMRVYGFVTAVSHLLSRARGGYYQMLKDDGVLTSWSSRWRRWRTLTSFSFSVMRRALRILNPWYDPRQTRDPAWALAWIARYEREGAQFRHLDMAQLGAPSPVLTGDSHAR
jgi:hypothetical protein